LRGLGVSTTDLHGVHLNPRFRAALKGVISRTL
jgi:hypothetical protein